MTEAASTEEAPEAGTEGNEGATSTLDDLLADLPEDARRVVEKEVRDARREAKNLRTRLKDIEPKAKQFDEATAQSQNETEREKQARAAAESRAAASDARAVKAEVKALAANTFADPEDAHAFLDLTDYVSDEGDVDAKAIERDLKDLLSRKPHLARGDGKHAPRPDLSQGSSGRGETQAPAARDQFADFLKRQRNGA